MVENKQHMRKVAISSDKNHQSDLASRYLASWKSVWTFKARLLLQITP